MALQCGRLTQAMSKLHFFDYNRVQRFVAIFK